MTEYNDGFDRGYAHGYESGYAQGRHDQLLELSEQILLKMCRCGHAENVMRGLPPNHIEPKVNGYDFARKTQEEIARLTEGSND